jgi:hygromycin-B 7''-O-kinase
MNIPAVSTREAYEKIFTNNEVWLPAMRDICERHQLPADNLSRMTFGTHIVFGTQAFIIKLICPIYVDNPFAEVSVLRQLQGFPVPAILGDGVMDGWPYFIMSVIPGRPAAEVWSFLNYDQQARIIRQLGALIQQLHKAAVIHDVDTDWDHFLKERIHDSKSHHDVEGKDWDWLQDQIGNFHEPQYLSVFTHADLTDDHIFLTQENGLWNISGVIDFGDAMNGHPFYELGVALVCFTAGNPVLARLLMESYGLEFSANVNQKLLKYCLLHRYMKMKELYNRYKVFRPQDLYAAMFGEEP